MPDYSGDAIYRNAANAAVRQGVPRNEEGNDGDELWCFVEGNDSGLYHAKKYAGEWRYRLYSPEILGEGDTGETIVKNVSYQDVTVSDGNFNKITVSNQTNLSGTSTIAGALTVSATTLSSFPTTANMTITGSKLDTAQNIQTSSQPRFEGLGVGMDASGESGNLEVSKILGIGAATVIDNSQKLYNTNYTSTGNVEKTDGLGLGDFTQGEVDQLQNIDSATINSTQWGYVGALDQHLTTSSDVQHAKMTLTDSGKTWTIDPIGGSGTNTLSGDLQITTTSTQDADIIIGGSSYDDHSVRSFAYTSGLFTGDGWAIYEDNNKHNMELDNLSVRGTLSVYELLIQQVRATNGSVFVTSAAKIKSSGLSHINGTSYYVLEFDTDDSDSGNIKPHPFADGDLILSRRVDISGDTTALVSETRWTVVDYNHGTAKQLKATNELYSVGGTSLPSSGATVSTIDGHDFVRIGNTTDANRRGGVYLTSDDTLSPFIDIFDEVSSWQEWDGISNIFGLDDGSFDLSTAGTYNSDGTITGSSWVFKEVTNGSATIETSGGISNQKYAKLDTHAGSSEAWVYQPVKMPYISTGSYNVMIEWYGKSDNTPRIALQDTAYGSSPSIYWDASGTKQSGTSSAITWTSITNPSAQPDTNTVWHRYQWKVNIPSSIFSGTNDKTLYLALGTMAGNDKEVSIDDVRIYMEGKVKTRIGRLEGVGKAGYGLWGENVYLKGRIEAQEGYIGNEFAGWRIDSTGLVNESNTSYISAGQGATTGFQQGGAFLNGEGKFSLGSTTGNRLKWDGTNLEVGGFLSIKDGPGYSGNTSGDGLYAFSDRLGFFKDTAGWGTDGWTAYMDNTGDFYLKGQAGKDGLTWDMATSSLSITGDLQFYDSNGNGPYKYPRLMQYIPSSSLNLGSAFDFTNAGLADYEDTNYRILYGLTDTMSYDPAYAGFKQKIKIETSNKTTAGFTPKLYLSILDKTTPINTMVYNTSGSRTAFASWTGDVNGTAYTSHTQNYDNSKDFYGFVAVNTGTSDSVMAVKATFDIDWGGNGGYTETTIDVVLRAGKKANASSTVPDDWNSANEYAYTLKQFNSAIIENGGSDTQQHSMYVEFPSEFTSGDVLAVLQLYDTEYEQGGGGSDGSPTFNGLKNVKMEYVSSTTTSNEITGTGIMEALVIHDGA